MTVAANARHVVLVGIGGAGKTTVAKLAADALGWASVDTDDLISNVVAVPAGEFFSSAGEPAFRDVESFVLGNLLDELDPRVVASGGGAVLAETNRELLREYSLVIWLRASIPTLVSRVGNGKGRPTLGNDPAAAYETLLEVRSSIYEVAAHETIDTDEMSVDRVAAAVVELAQRYGIAGAAGASS